MKRYNALLTAFTVTGFVIASQGVSASSLPPSAQALGTLPSGTYSQAGGISGNGLIATGTGDGTPSQAFIWTAGGGMTGLGLLAGGTYSGAEAISSDGTVVIGTANDGTGWSKAFMWTSGGGMVSLGTLGGNDSHGYNISGDGLTIVGMSTRPDSLTEAFRWTSGGGMVGLGFLNVAGFRDSAALGINADGSVIVGRSSSATSSNQAFRWTSGTGMVGLGFLGTGNSSFARDTDATGSIVVGYGDNGTTDEAFRWTSGTGMVGLGTLAGGGFSNANAISADGSTIVGNAYDGTDIQAVMWTTADGIRSIKSILDNAGVSTTDWQFTGADDVSDDGSVIIGNGYYMFNQTAFIFTNGNGVVGMTTPTELADSLVPTTIPSQQSSALIADGIGQSLLVARNALTTYFPNIDTHIVDVSSMAFMSPELSLSPQDIAPAAGAEDFINALYGRKRTAIYTTGTFGMGQNNDFANSALNGTAGLLIELNDKVAIGGGILISKTKQETRLSGESQVDATGLSAMASYESSSGVRFYGTVAAADLKVSGNRNYLNGSSIDGSKVDADGLGLGASARVGYEINSYEDIMLMPYAEVQWAHSQLDAYTETGGAFPVSVAEQKGNNLITRFGMEGSKDINPDLTFRARAAWGHRHTNGSDVTVSTLGFTQTLTGDEGDKDWLEGGIGVNYKISDDTTISGEIAGRSGKTTDPAVNATVGLIWTLN